MFLLQTRLPPLCSNFRLRSKLSRERLRGRIDVRALRRSSLDSSDAAGCVPATFDGLWRGLPHQLHRHLLPRIQGHSIHYHGKFSGIFVFHVHFLHYCKMVYAESGYRIRESKISWRNTLMKDWIQLAVTAICLFVILPLTLIGTVLGRNMSGQGDYPCRLVNGWNAAVELSWFRVNAVPRPIPDKKWYVQPWLITLMGGVLPFGSIFIEMSVFVSKYIKSLFGKCHSKTIVNRGPFSPPF